MAFTCECELRIDGGAPGERRAAAEAVLAADCVEDEGASRREEDAFLELRFASVDGLPEEELAVVAPQFPGLGFVLAYFSRDGEFLGYARSGTAGSEAASADFDERTLEELATRYAGDWSALVRDAFGLERRG